MRLKQIFRSLISAVRRYDDTHNYTCDVCSREVFCGERVCLACRETLPWNNLVFCPLCGRKLLEEGICLDCKERPLSVEKARSVFTHDGEAKRLIVRFKRGERYLYRTLAELALPLLLMEFPHADAVTFVPMTPKAEKKRGYNQSRLLAEELALRAKRELIAPAVKQRESKAQKTLGRREREENLKGCFHVDDRKSVKGRNILIVDDTMTTGATASELADCFYRAGAKSVSLLTVTSVTKKFPFGKPPKKP